MRLRGCLQVIGRYRSPVCALMLTLTCVFSACGSTHPKKTTLILDFTPNAVHAGIYRALAAGYYKHENIDLRVVAPTSTQETLKLIDAGRAQFGLADGSDVAGLIDKGADARAVMALVQR